MKKILVFIAVGILLPILTLAQQVGSGVFNDEIAYASVFTGNFSLLLSLVIGIIANFTVFQSAKKLKGGLFGSVLNYIGIGMSLVILGTLSTIIDPLIIGSWFNVAGTVLFSMGYIFMVIGANKLFKGIMST